MLPFLDNTFAPLYGLCEAVHRARDRNAYLTVRAAALQPLVYLAQQYHCHSPSSSSSTFFPWPISRIGLTPGVERLRPSFPGLSSYLRRLWSGLSSSRTRVRQFRIHTPATLIVFLPDTLPSTCRTTYLGIWRTSSRSSSAFWIDMSLRRVRSRACPLVSR
ncbi:hypothetical protein B0H13DRAFT_1112437 [Mycena leptocephala]|nr:hypothetical protein B0H13DRAFT_1112437 [Mycena leptocephala]